MAEFISLYSGSSGNSSVVRCGQRYLIVDMGKGVRTTSAALKALGLAVSDCDGILVTHEHSDHVKGLSTFLKKNTLPVYGAAATLDFLDGNGIVPASCELHELEGREEDVGAFGVQSFPTSHDVPCVGYRIHTPDGKTMTIATDLGVLTPPVHEALSGCDLVALESNYDLHMLRSGPYPYYLRARIESTRGHLSNDECSAKLLELIQEGCKKFALCHLSQENNTPALALQTVFNTLGAAGVVPEKDSIVQAQRRNEMSPVFGNGVFVVIEIIIVIYPGLYVIGGITYFFYISGCQRKCKYNGMRELPVLCFTQV